VSSLAGSEAAGIEPVRADLADAASFGRTATSADGVIQTASTADAHSPDYEPKAAQAIPDAIAGAMYNLETGAVDFFPMK
jgi:uncharacterized protein YbjT (DUF2867 family)